MTNNGLSKLSFNALDRITDVFPSFGPKIFQKIFLSIFGSDKFYSYYLKKYRGQLLKTKYFDKILIMVDLNIGDAVLLQKSVEVARYYFPNARIDYLCNRLGGELISELPMADNIYKVFRGGGAPSESDLNTLREIITVNNYGLILNLSPFVKKEDFPNGINTIQLYVLFTVYILYLWRVKAEQMHISNIICSFLNDFLKPLPAFSEKNKIEIVKKPFHSAYKGNTVYLPHDAIWSAHEFLESHNIFSMERLLLFNPDVTVKYSMIPFEIQIQILKKILESNDIDYVLIAAAYFNSRLEEKILKSLPEELHAKVIIVPHMPLNTFVALIDLCDVFLTGDTGPLHIAASWKEPIDENDRLRNRTSVVSIIGPTDSRMFCYDSAKPGHLPASQNAPSKVFAAEAPCRNVTCLNKTVKTCKEVRCFANIDPDKISSYIISCFHYRRTSVQKLG
jgi:ADP-heptose:LPS heptosyltransferase